MSTWSSCGAEAQILFFCEKVVGLKAVEWNTQRKKSMEGGAGILLGGPNEDVEIIGSADVAVRIDGDSADDGVFNFCGEERGEE